ncbi:MAG: hypothetical protein O7D36_06875, partial [Gammaproteobacteria bacterium]|nr:hypothetical protein [Gammaproteobacteria bacterium]
MQCRYLDCSNEVSELRSPSSQRLVWLAHDISESDWLIDLPRQALQEIRQLATFIEDNPLQMLQRRVDDLSLPDCRKSMSRMKSILDDGVGFVVLDGLPVGEFPFETLVEVYWVLGQCIGRPVAQKW